MFRKWLKENPQFRNHKGSGPSYLGQRRPSQEDKETTKTIHPFPENPHFVSEPVLSEASRQSIWKAVMKRALPLKAVSARFNVDIRRVAAVVRMKQIEKQWEHEGKQLAHAYHNALMGMLPTADLKKIYQEGLPPFEEINEMHVHGSTMQQLFVPVPESQHFGRREAAKAFGDKVLPADHRLRVPELLQFEKDKLAGMDRRDAHRKFLKATAESERRIAAREREKQQAHEARIQVVDTGRSAFRFEDYNSEDIGKTGRARHAIGWRYGVPHDDRRRGAVKIPTKVGL